MNKKDKAIGWSCSEIVTIGLINITECQECKKLIHYNGLTPKFCSIKCRDKRNEFSN